MDGVIAYSSNEYVFGHFSEYKESYRIVNIQFPEAIFRWSAPSEEELIHFEKEILKWKRKSKIVYCMNDFESHFDKKKKFKKLFELIHRYSDLVIHLGFFSLQKYKGNFSDDCMQRVVKHPLYISLLDNFEIKNIQNLLPYNLSDKFIISVPGNMRSKNEFEFVLGIFEKLPMPNKFLIIPRMSKLVNVPDVLPYRFRKIYRDIMWAFYERRYLRVFRGQYYFMNNFLDYSFLTDLIQKSSLLIIPRIKNLNSGNLFLGLTFDKLMIAPSVGNLTEHINDFRLPVINHEVDSFDKIVSLVLESDFLNYSKTEEYKIKKDELHPKVISQQYDNIYQEVLNLI
ncbi:hypothetical protein RCH33_3198 [Flavobacterium daejeonense]|nr:hypothetical protein RCH33_3198 [Flavobacterium daejeonense]